MKKKKLADIDIIATAAKTDYVIVGDKRISIENLLSSIGVASGYFAKHLLIGEEVNTGYNGVGLFVITTVGNGVVGVFAIGAFPEMVKLVSESNPGYFNVGDLPNKLCIYRKVTSGPVFIKNNTNSNRSFRMYMISSPIV